MRRSQHTEGEILHLLLEASAGLSIAQICSAARITPRTFYRWRRRYGGLTLPAVREMKELQLENLRLRTLVNSLSARLDGTAMKIPSSNATKVAGRPDQGCERNGPSAIGSEPMRGASAGRFAFVRGLR
ncbi:MAG: transposase [Methylocella sp.]